MFRACKICGMQFVPRHPTYVTCSPGCSARWKKAKTENRSHIRRVNLTDITHQQEAEMRRKARKCSLCGTWLTSKPNMPNSKELDHIVPINQGGTHTHGNVRIICGKCNRSRPKDGSDYVGPVTLWAQDPSVLIKLPKPKKPPVRVAPSARCRCGATFVAHGNQFLCAACIEVTGHRAAELHAAGMSWEKVAAETGYRSGQGAWYAAKRVGYSPVRRVQIPKAPSYNMCACGTAVRKKPGPWHSTCDACVMRTALRAVDLRDQGQTLRIIADQLGYRSITSVTNLMAVAGRASGGMGRPANVHAD